MATEEKIFPYKGVNLNVHESLMAPDLARFIKNLVYEVTDASDASASRGAQTGVGKTLQSNSLYIENLVLPDGYNQIIGAFGFKEEGQVFVMLYNERGNHMVYVLNGADQTFSIVKQGSVLNFQLSPEYFIHKSGCWLEVVYIEDPNTGKKIKRSFLIFTDGFNDQRQICVEDAIATNGFDPTQFPYFRGDFDPKIFINMGIATPVDCVEFSEKPRSDADLGLDNNLSFNPWQFRVLAIDVWGRPTEHGIISDEYIPGINDCVSSSNSLSRCLTLKIKADNPLWDKLQVEFRTNNSEQWYLDQVLNLYDGSNLGPWWTRSRNPDIDFDPNSGMISYTFCRDKECNPVPQSETDRLENPMPRTSQAIQKINQFLTLWNNKERFAPMQKSLLDKFSFKITPPAKQNVDSRTITIYVPIWNEALQNYQSVRKDGTNGYIWGDNNSSHGGARAYSQFFQNIQQSGFLGYLLGNGNLAISTQVYVDAGGNIIDDPEFLGQNLSPSQFTMQKFVFNNVPSGVYIFRLASHLADPSAPDNNYTTTSTTVWGRCPFDKASLRVSPEQRAASQELIIDVCAGDYNTLEQTEILVIADLAAVHVEQVPGQLTPISGFKSINESYKATSGYIYETRQNGFNQNPMELMSVTNPHAITSRITDHNGFYYFSTSSTHVSFEFRFANKCGIGSFGQNEGNAGMRFSNHYIDEERQGTNVFPYGDYFTTVCNRVLIKGRAFLSGQNIGIPNATIVLSRGGVTTTDDNGDFTLVAHDEIDADSGQVIIRNDILIFANGICNYVSIDGGCIPDKNISIQPCSSCTLRQIIVSDFVAVYNIQRSLLSGGTYPMGVAKGDWLGRRGFVQDIGYITIPSIIESQAIGPSTVELVIDPTAIFDEDTEYISIFIGKETTMAQYLTWIVDRFELIDNTGNINTVSPTQIRIYYGSLNEYNKQNEFNTTTGWSFIAEGQNTPVVSDKVQFFLNGNGKFFDKSIIGLVKYDQAGEFFLIDYTPDLADLVANAMIRLIRPKVCTGNEPYYELCGVIKVTNGAAETDSIILNAFDTFYLSRQIPVPVPVTPTPQVQTVATSTTSGNVTTTITSVPVPVATANALRIFGFRFEHDSPSNFWGKGSNNFGRVNLKNPFEAVIYNINACAISGTLSKNSQLNYLNYFDDANKVYFDINTLNGVVGVFTQNSIVLVVGQNDNFIVGFNDDIPVVNAQGQLTIPSGKNQFGNPQLSIGDRYGCRLFDKNTIDFRQGIVQFLDTSEMAVIRHNYSKGQPISDTSCAGYIRSKIASVNKFNLTATNKRYFHGSMDPAADSYILSDFIIRSASFLNKERGINVDVQESFSFNINTGALKGWWSATPEYYASLEGDFDDPQLFTFRNGQPWKHYSSGQDVKFGSIYGETVEPVFDVVCVIDNMKKKKPLAVAQYIIGGLFYCDLATSEAGQQTRMLISQWQQANYGWFAPFLCDLNTKADKNIADQTGKNKLFDGNILVGNWIRVRLVGSPASNNNYVELQGITVNVMAAEKSGL